MGFGRGWVYYYPQMGYDSALLKGFVCDPQMGCGCAPLTDYVRIVVRERHYTQVYSCRPIAEVDAEEPLLIKDSSFAHDTSPVETVAVTAGIVVMSDSVMALGENRGESAHTALNLRWWDLGKGIGRIQAVDWRCYY